MNRAGSQRGRKLPRPGVTRVSKSRRDSADRPPGQPPRKIGFSILALPPPRHFDFDEYFGHGFAARVERDLESETGAIADIPELRQLRKIVTSSDPGPEHDARRAVDR